MKTQERYWHCGIISQSILYKFAGTILDGVCVSGGRGVGGGGGVLWEN